MKDIILIDAGTGNLRSVQKALEAVGATVDRTDDPQKVLSAKKVVLPGVGSFGDFMSGLQMRRLDVAIKEVAQRNIPLLGICVGMQALFEIGEEMGEHEGLGLLKGTVVKFAESLSVKIPHTGWNQVHAKKDALLFEQVNNEAYVYFNHSYYCQAQESSDVIAEVDYGICYACAVRREKVFGVQFHPEKSQAVGLQILKNFVEAA
jgi:imidazole glycerol-phosphate synthase subunit HisH